MSPYFGIGSQAHKVHVPSPLDYLHSSLHADLEVMHAYESCKKQIKWTRAEGSRDNASDPRKMDLMFQTSPEMKNFFSL
jgi:hypothetical protein